MKIKHLLTIAFILSLIFDGFGQLSEQEKKTLQDYKAEKIKLEQEEAAIKKKITNINIKIGELESKDAGAVVSSTQVNAKTTMAGGALREKPSSVSAEIAKVPGNEAITVIGEVEGLYVKVTWKGKTGWMSYSSIEQSSEVDAVMSQKNNQKDSDEKMKRLTKVYGKEIATKICAGMLWEGMSQGMVIESIGRPENTTKDKTDEGIREVWTYSNKEVVFMNGSLTNWNKK